ncbi:MAG: 1-deoxy-D-xylulose-5-phosphate synthase [Leptospirales bacterium]|nr:1-deoxy-D-xylulose-5-phosphate synthase [Leptospirales bacterium]
MNKKYDNEKTEEYTVLDNIKSVNDIKNLNFKALTQLSDDVRNFIIDSVSQTGGHLASSLGTVELTVALHYAFNTPDDRIIWDVGHQTYAHKILTGRKDRFHTLRTFGGISGFPKTSESEFDAYNVGHSSTSLSLALGEAISRDINGDSHKVIAVIGDASLTGGVAFEALNQIGSLKHDLIIVLNDNKHSISINVGAISTYLTRLISSDAYNRFRKSSQTFVRKIPIYGTRLFKIIYKIVNTFKNMFIHGSFFQDMGIRYFGPIDGHNVESLCDIFERVKNINSGPKIIHVITQKGRGYPPAENNPSSFHGASPFDKATGKDLGGNSGETYSSIAGKTLALLSASDKKLIAITAAMKHGTGLIEFENAAPERFFDVGIAEQHAVTFASAMAKNGMRPFVSIYSTFLQRAADQLIHDVGIMNLPVRVLVDRAGIVGPDGETHHGLFDIAMIKNIPNFIFLAPSSGEELRDMIYFAAQYDDGPIAIRFPKGVASNNDIDLSQDGKFAPGKIKRLSRGKDLAIIALGDMTSIALETAALLEREGIKSSVIDLQSIRPLDIDGIEEVLNETSFFITLENGIACGGIGEHITACVRGDLRPKNIFIGGFPDEFIPHGNDKRLFKEYALDAESLAKRVLGAIKNERKTHTA